MSRKQILFEGLQKDVPIDPLILAQWDPCWTSELHNFKIGNLCSYSSNRKLTHGLLEADPYIEGTVWNSEKYSTHTKRQAQWCRVLCPFPFINLVISLYKFGDGREVGRVGGRKEIERGKDKKETETKNSFCKCGFEMSRFHAVSMNSRGDLSLYAQVSLRSSVTLIIWESC